MSYLEIFGAFTGSYILAGSFASLIYIIRYWEDIDDELVIVIPFLVTYWPLLTYEEFWRFNNA